VAGEGLDDCRVTGVAGAGAARRPGQRAMGAAGAGAMRRRGELHGSGEGGGLGERKAGVEKKQGGIFSAA
jgi:hypothetical protein